MRTWRAMTTESRRRCSGISSTAFGTQAGRWTITTVLDFVPRFAALATQIASFELADMTRDLDESPEAAAESLLREGHSAFTDYLTNAELYATAGRILGQPELGLELDRELRRSLS
jgi:hypothetical protein